MAFRTPVILAALVSVGTFGTGVRARATVGERGSKPTGAGPPATGVRAMLTVGERGSHLEARPVRETPQPSISQTDSTVYEAG